MTAPRWCDAGSQSWLPEGRRLLGTSAVRHVPLSDEIRITARRQLIRIQLPIGTVAGRGVGKGLPFVLQCKRPEVAHLGRQGRRPSGPLSGVNPPWPVDRRPMGTNPLRKTESIKGTRVFRLHGMRSALQVGFPDGMHQALQSRRIEIPQMHLRNVVIERHDIWRENARLPCLRCGIISRPVV
jgi:hypothetical protein